MRGDSLTKTLQEFNRKKIICAVNLTRLEKYEDENLTLDRVLIALKNIKCSWLDSDADWNLTKSTLEEQSEETQRAIYKLLGGENGY